MTEIKIIDRQNKNDINIPNRPFAITGKMIPEYTNGQWSYTVNKYDEKDIKEMCFPDENYDYDAMSVSSVFLGAYENGKCIGLAILQKGFFKYMYLYDLKVDRTYRRRGTGKKLIEKAAWTAAAAGYKGIYTIAQDNNLAACAFYLKCGFRIGGFDTDVYKWTSQEGKADIIFYMDI